MRYHERYGTVLAGCVVVLICLSIPSVVRAELEGFYSTSWTGNSFGGADGKWVQNFIVHMNTTPAGLCYTWSHYDEGGRNYGLYLDGDVAGNLDMGADSMTVTDLSGRVWEIVFMYMEQSTTARNEYEIIPLYIRCDGVMVEFPGLYEPMALAISNDGLLMIADSQTSPRQQILFYDVTDWENPVLVRTFGDYGGIGSGIPGIVTPMKFWGIRGIGVDAQGNIYVGMSEQGTVIRKLTPGGELVWELYDHDFLDVKVCDPATDCLDVWGVANHYVMDFTNSDGEEATWTGYTLDRVTYPQDPRGNMAVTASMEHGICTPMITYIEGQRFIYTIGQPGNYINIFRFDGEIAIPSGLIMMYPGPINFGSSTPWPNENPPDWPGSGRFIWRDVNGDGHYQADEYFANLPDDLRGACWVDERGDIWLARGFKRYECLGLDPVGNPIYDVNHVYDMPVPDGITRTIKRVHYEVDRDILILGEQYGRSIQPIHICHNYMQGNRTTIPFVSSAGVDTYCLAIAGEYIFTAGWLQKGRVFVNRLYDGKHMGVMVPGPEVGGVENTGWIDIIQGISAYRRSNNEYIVHLEEDYLGKVLMYRWCPGGDCNASSPDNLAATYQSQPGAIRITWQDNTAGDLQESGFVVQRRPWLGQYDWGTVGTVGPDVVQYDDTQYLHGEVLYEYRVGAYWEQ